MRIKALEEIDGQEQLNSLQRIGYAEIKNVLEPIDETKIDTNCSGVITKTRGRALWIEMTVTPIDKAFFGVTVFLFSHDINLSLGPMHSGCGNEFKASRLSEMEFAARKAAELAQLFSGSIKLIEQQSNGRSFRWLRYDLTDNRWQRQEETGLLFYHYFGKKTQIERFCKLY